LSDFYLELRLSNLAPPFFYQKKLTIRRFGRDQ
jgi:hypothetical protein